MFLTIRNTEENIFDHYIKFEEILEFSIGDEFKKGSGEDGHLYRAIVTTRRGTEHYLVDPYEHFRIMTQMIEYNDRRIGRNETKYFKNH